MYLKTTGIVNIINKSRSIWYITIEDLKIEDKIADMLVGEYGANAANLNKKILKFKDYYELAKLETEGVN